MGAATITEPGRPPPLPQYKPGVTIDRYVLQEQLGSGGMGVVWAASDPKLGRRVAIKLVRASGNQRSNARLLREARAMAKLAHPAVVPIFDVGEDGDQVYIVMELVDGRTLRDCLERTKPPWREVVAMFVRAGRGLAAAHEAGIIHRDFKPENVLVGDDGRVRVTDFGLARLAGDDPDEPSDEAAATAVTITRSGAVMGTPAYMAPEQHLGQPIGPAADQFAFCVALFEALYGERPFRGAEAVAAGTPRSVDQRDVPAPIHRMLAQGLVANPAARWPTLVALLDALESAGRPQRRTGWWIAIAAVVALAAATLAIAWPRDATKGRDGVEAGLTAWRRGSTLAARRAWAAALVADPDDAPSALRLGLWSSTTIEGRTNEARTKLRLAARHRDRLTARESALLDASVAMQQPVPDLAAWETALGQLVTRDPEHHEARFFFARVQELRGNFTGALATLEPLERTPETTTIALAERGRVEKERWQLVPAARTFERCLASSLDATDCLAGQTRLLALAGRCDEMERTVHRWLAADEQDPAASEALAMVLATTGAPIEAVREALEAKWRKQAASTVAITDLAPAWIDRFRLASLHADFTTAMAEAQTEIDRVASSPSVIEHFDSSLRLLIAAQVGGDTARAGRVSMEFLQRARAWTPETPRQVAVPLIFLGGAAHAGVITPGEHDTERRKWLAFFDRAIAASGGAVDPYTHAFPWVIGYAATTKTPEEAAVALAALPSYEPLPAPGTRESDIDLVIGGVYHLAGQYAAARPYLESAARSCLVLENPFATIPAHVHFGELLIATGDLERGRAELETALRFWGNPKPESPFMTKAKAALERLPR